MCQGEFFMYSEYQVTPGIRYLVQYLVPGARYYTHMYAWYMVPCMYLPYNLLWQSVDISFLKLCKQLAIGFWYCVYANWLLMLRPNIQGLLKISKSKHVIFPYGEFKYQVSAWWNFNQCRHKGLTSTNVRILQVFVRRICIICAHIDKPD